MAEPTIRPDQVSYFVTVRTFGCRSVFHDEARAAAAVELIESVRQRVGLKKYGYVVLPDHYHVLFGSMPDSRSVADVVLAINRAIEGLITVPDDGQPLWDDEPEVLVIYTAPSRLEKLNYMHHKPVLCGLVESAQDYQFSSARFYYQRYGKTEF
ncbi:MAG: transposase [Candidatus Brocadiia bacterium]